MAVKATLGRKTTLRRKPTSRRKTTPRRKTTSRKARRETSAVRASEGYTAGQRFVGEMWQRNLGLWVWSREDGYRSQSGDAECEDGGEMHDGL